MFSEGSLPDWHQYRAGYNPDFIRKVHEKRRRAEKQRAKEEAIRASKREAQAIAEVEAQQEHIQRSIEEIAASKRGSAPKHRFSDIEARATKALGITRAELRGDRRHSDIAFARQFVAYWASRLTDHSYPMIGRLMGGRDHTTVIHGKNAYRAKRAKMGRFLREAR